MKNQNQREPSKLPPLTEQQGAAYAPPEILWEQEFVALATVSNPNCPPEDESCIP